MYKQNVTKIFRQIGNLQLAIWLLFFLGIMIAVGTIIEQGQSLNFYKETYSKSNTIKRFFFWKIIIFWGLDRIYSSWVFLIILLIFASSLLACTFTTQVPSVKTFKIWKFINQQNQYKKLKINIQLKSGISNNLAFNCNENKYHFFRKHKKGYAYSGLLGRIAPVSVHISMIILLLGSTLGSFTGYAAQEIIPRGEVFHIQNLTKFGNISYVRQTFFCRINNF